MRMLTSNNLVQLYGVYETDNSIYLSMEFAEGITLDSYLRHNREIALEARRAIMRGLLRGVRDMAAQSILHRDIKPENIIVSSGLESIKIVDFGLATDVNDP